MDMLDLEEMIEQVGRRGNQPSQRGSRLGRSELLRSLRHSLRAQSQGIKVSLAGDGGWGGGGTLEGERRKRKKHSTILVLESRGGGGESSTPASPELKLFVTSRVTPERPGGAHVGLPERVALELD